MIDGYTQRSFVSDCFPSFRLKPKHFFYCEDTTEITRPKDYLKDGTVFLFL